jgi:DNA-binding response OmpR family regulator
MVTASGEEQKIKALEAGADDFLNKPINKSELLARVASLARIKRYQDTIKRQSERAGRLEQRAARQGGAAGVGDRTDEQAAALPFTAAGGVDR